jgi:signal peptidase I
MTASEDERARVESTDLPDGEPGPETPDKPISEPEPKAEPQAIKPPPRKAEPAKKGMSFLKELPILILIALVLTFLIQTFVARVYVIPSGSMEQTLQGCSGCDNDRVLVDKVLYRFAKPAPGEVVVFKGPAGWEHTEFAVDDSENAVVRVFHSFFASIGMARPNEYDLVKRVIAVGGQTVACCDAHGGVTVDGRPLDEPYVYWQPDRAEPGHQASFDPVKVPDGYIWVMGDNRNNSEDSRFQNGASQHNPSPGVVPVDNVIGKVRTVLWPPSRWSGVGDHNPQNLAAPAWESGLPAGVGLAAAWPALWLGRRFRGAVRLRGSVGKGS